MDYPKLVVLGLREHRIDSLQERFGEALEPLVRRSLKDDAVRHHENAPGLVSGPVLPARLFDDLDRRSSSRTEDELLYLAGTLDGVPPAAEFFLDRRDVVAHLDGAESYLTQHQHQGLRG